MHFETGKNNNKLLALATGKGCWLASRSERVPDVRPIHPIAALLRHNVYLCQHGIAVVFLDPAEINNNHTALLILLEIASIGTLQHILTKTLSIFVPYSNVAASCIR